MGWWPWSKGKRFDHEAVEITGAELASLILTCTGGGGAAVTRDLKYLLLDEELLRVFVWKYYHPSVSYHSNSEEFPDCDDAADMAKGSIIYGAVKEGMRYCPAFGGIEYKTRRTGGWHAANIVVTRAKRVLVFEPQSMDWRDLRDEVDEMRRVSF